MNVGSLTMSVQQLSPDQLLSSKKTAAKPEAQLEAYMKQSPAERMREAILKKLGVTEEEMAQMPPEQQEAVTRQIADMMKQEMDKQGMPSQGAFVNTSA